MGEVGDGADHMLAFFCSVGSGCCDEFDVVVVKVLKVLVGVS